ncbi:MAG: CBS domain-containing protein [Myxococcota bacterium]
MKCRDVMKKTVQTCGADETVSMVAKRMRDHNIGFMPVGDGSGRLIGTVTDRDLAIRVLADSANPDTAVRNVMSQGVISCSPDDPLRTAEELMAKHQKSRIVCTDADGKPQGVISLSDIAEVERAGKAAGVMKAVSAREAHP